MEIRLAEKRDLEEIMKIVDQAKEYFKKEGIDQWQNGYPNQASIEDDLAGGNFYVYEEQQKILGIMAAVPGLETSYEKIYKGQWLSQEDSYLTLHRVAVNMDEKGRGLASKMFKMAEDLARELGLASIRIDTHIKNSSMRRLIEKNKFSYCGLVYVADGERLAYEKLI